jgi:hypothetical protein
MKRTISPVEFIDRLVKKSELGKPFKLFPHQRVILNLAFAFDENGKLPYDTIIFLVPKSQARQR